MMLPPPDFMVKIVYSDAFKFLLPNFGLTAFSKCLLCSQHGLCQSPQGTSGTFLHAEFVVAT